MSTFTAYTPKGFAAWSIIEGTTNANDVFNFLNVELDHVLTDDTFLLLDNASVNKTPDEIVRLLLDKFYDHFSYSPRYKPVERGLSLVKRYSSKILLLLLLLLVATT